MQKNEHTVTSDGDRCAKAVSEAALQQVTPAQIKNAAAALANLMRSHEGTGGKMRASALSTFLSLPKSAIGDVQNSDDEAEDVESVGEEDVDKSRFLLSQKTLRSSESGHLDPETRARLRALLESTGLGKLSTADSKALADPEVLRRLTDKVNSAMDEAASTLMRIKAEQQKGASALVPGSSSGACGSSSSDIDVVHLTLEDGQLCPAELEQALEGDSLLLMACSAGYYQLAEALLALKSDVEDRGTKGDRTPLMEAACGGYLDIVRLLIANKADVNAQAPSGNTALHYAACSGFVEIAQELLAAGARVEEPNENGHTPLMEAATAGQVEVAKLLLANGANINTHSTEFKESALTLACYKGHLDMVKFLLEKGADLEHKTDEMHTALMEASMDGHVEVARLLLDRGAQVNMPPDSFESPLTLAACGGHTELASLLIDRGANLEEVNDEGYTPLMEAVREGHEDMVTLLLHRNAEVNAQTEETQETALTLACCGGFLEIAELLVNAGANIELGCSTPLMEAAQEGHVELVKFLISSKANVNAQTFTKGTALTYACENGHTEVAEVLVEHGAELDHESEGGRTALMRAAKNGHLRTVEFLVSKGANVNKATTNNDHTVLSVACASGHLQVVEFLLRSGADFTHKLKDGSTMLIEAAKGGHFDIMNMLLDWPSSGANHAAQLANTAAGLEAALQLNKLSQDVSAAVSESSNQGGVKMVSANRASAGVRDAPDGVGVPAKSNAGKIVASPVVDSGKHMADLAVPDDGSWEAFVGRMATKGDLVGLDRDEQIVVKQQMLDRLMQLERELQERSLSGKAPVGSEDPEVGTKLYDEAAARNRFVVVDDRLRGDEELAIAILEKAVLGETVLDRVVLEQLKAYIRGSAGDSPMVDVVGDGSQSSGSDCRAHMHDGSGDFIHDLDNSSISSSSEEGEKFEDACGDPSSQDALPGDLVDKTPQLDRVEKQQVSASPQRCTIEQLHVALKDAAESLRSPAEGGDAAIPVGQAKVKDRPIAKVQRRLSKPQQGAAVTGAAQKVPKPSDVACVATGHQPSSDVERNLTLQQQRQQLQAQLALQQQLHDELQQHLKLQQEHQQLQAQLKVKDDPSVLNDNMIAPGTSHGLSLEHQCCRHQHPCPQQRQHVQQQLLQLQHQLQQVAGKANVQQAQQQAKNLAMLYQKHSSLTAAGTTTQSTQTPAASANDGLIGVPPGKAAVSPLTGGNAAVLAAQKKAADLAAITGNSGNMMSAANNIRPARQQAAGTQTRTGNIGAPCPNCCIDAAKHLASSAPRPPVTGMPSPIDVNATTESNHDTALTLAAAGGHARLVALLLSRGAKVDHHDKKGLTPLMLAAAAGHVEVCEVLLANKAEIDGVSEKNKDTALSLACSNGRLEVVELLLAKGANKEHRNISDYTPLSQAASGGYVNVIKVLLAHGAEINSRTGSKMGISPLMLAAMNGHTAAVKLLLDMGSDINAQIETNRNTALTLACFQGRYEVVSLLIDRRANIEHRAKTGLTPLMEAASGGYVEVGRVLLDKGADIAAAPVPVSRDTALTIAADKGHHRFVELLLARGAAVDVKNKKGNTPLWLACNGGHVEVVQLLVAAGADVHSEDHRHVSCIMAAFRKAHVKVVKVLVRHVTQFPPDQDCLRYIATLTDKEMVKRCHQCMTLIVSAKEQQAAEANKIAAILLEELSLEREREETKKAAAARKRDRKRLKKKEKADREKDLDTSPSDTMINGNDIDVDDTENISDVAVTLEKTVSVVNGSYDKPDLILPPSGSVDAGKVEKQKEPLLEIVAVKNAKNDVTVASTDDTGSANTAAGNGPEASRRNRRNRRDRNKGSLASTKQRSEDEIPMADVATSALNGMSVDSTVLDSQPIKCAPVNSYLIPSRDVQRELPSYMESARTSLPLTLPPSSSTGIGELDDFGSLSITPVPAMKAPAVKKSATEKPRITLVEQKGPLPAKRGTAATNKSGTRKNQKRDDDWEEVSRKYVSKRLLVPANAISRVIGRGGCNINAIRDISTAQVEIDRSRDSTTERIITIKGSVEAARYAQMLIEALVNDTDKKFEQQLPKLKPLQSGSGAATGQKQKAAASNKSSSMTSALSKEDQSKTKRAVPLSTFPIGAWAQPPSLQQKSKPVTSSSSASVLLSAWSGDSQARSSPDVGRMSYSDRAKAAVSSAGDLRSISPPSEKAPVSSSATVSVSAVSSATITPPVRSEPQPLPIITATGMSTASSARLAPSTSAVLRDYSPFDNVLSQIAESVLAKRAEDFASVAAAGIVTSSPPVPASFSEESLVLPAASMSSDPELMAKAPGYKPQACADPSKAPGHRMSRDGNARPGVSEANFRPGDYGRPSSTPTAAVHSPLMEDESVGPVGRALGASLDRPASFYGGPPYTMGGLNFAQPPPPPGLMQQFNSMTHPEFMSSMSQQTHQFGAPRTLGSAVNETSVLAAPLMATSVASASQPGCIGNNLVMPVTAPVQTSAGHACLPDDCYVEGVHQSPAVASEPMALGPHSGPMEDRKTLGPIGTERAARRPQVPPPTVPYMHDFGIAPPIEAHPSMWPFSTDANWSHNQPFEATLANQSTMLAAAGFSFDDGLLRSQHPANIHMGYPGLGDVNAMMMPDVCAVDASAIDHNAMQQMLQQNHQAMMMPSAMFGGGDISGSYNGMLGHVPTGFATLGNAGNFMMANDESGYGWSTSATATDMGHYLGPKAPHMMWNQNWTPSANM